MPSTVTHSSLLSPYKPLSEECPRSHCSGGGRNSGKCLVRGHTSRMAHSQAGSGLLDQAQCSFRHTTRPHSCKPAPVWPPQKRISEGPILKSGLQLNKHAGSFSSLYSADRQNFEGTKARKRNRGSVPSFKSAFQKHKHPRPHRSELQ